MASTAVLLGVTCLFVLFIRTYLASRGSQRGQADDDSESDKQNEIEGGVWEKKSVFELMEQGLRDNPEGLALICMFQPAAHLGDLVSETTKMIEGSVHVNGRAHGQNNIFKSTPHINNTNIRDAMDLSPQSASEYLTLTYRELHKTALRLAVGLVAHGASAETTMVMAIPNGAEYAVLLWACVLARITYVSLDPSMLDISGFTALKHTLQTIKPQILVAPTAASGKALDVATAELQLAAPIRMCLAGPEIGGWQSLGNLVRKGRDFTAEEEESMMEAARRDRPTRIHSIMFTSGTSGGPPKGCPQRISGMAHALQSQSWLFDKGTRALMQLHNSRGIAPAQTLQTWYAGGTVILTGQSFNARDALDAIARVKAEFIVLSPPMVHDMMDARRAWADVDVACVRFVQVGGDTITRGLLERCAGLFPQARVCVNHGMTEGPGAFVWPWSASRQPDIAFYAGEICPAGAVAPGACVRITDDGDKVLARGQPGELHVSCPSIIAHYWGGRAEVESFYEDRRGKRWFRTGDFAIADKDGLVFVLGRKKNIIRRAGVPVMPAVIESLIEAYTGAQTVVIPVKHHVLGAEPFAVLSTYNGKSQGQIRDRIREVLGKNYSLGGVASLKQLGLLDFPVNSTHKIVRSEIQLAVDSYLNAEFVHV